MTAKIFRTALITLTLALALLLVAACGAKDEPVIAETTIETTVDNIGTTTPEETSSEVSTSEEASTSVTGTSVADASTSTGTTTSAAAPLTMSKAQIIAAYTTVLNNVKTRQPTYHALDYQEITNKKELPADMVKMLNTYFYKGGEETLIPAIESLIDTRQLETYEHAAPGETRKHPSGERVPGSKGNARWFGVSMNDKGCLAKESDVKSATIKDLGNDRYQIDIIVADCRNPKTIKEGAATAPNPIAAFMEVQDISVVFDILNNAIARNAAKLVGVDLKNSSYMQYSGSSCKLVYNAKTMECESLHQIGKFSMTLDGSIKGIDCSGKKVKISAFYDYTKFQWNTAYKA